MFSTDFSLYSHKALYVHPKALNGDSKASDVRSKPSNGGQKLLIVTTHVMGCWLVIFIPPSTKNLNNINFLCSFEDIYYFCSCICLQKPRKGLVGGCSLYEKGVYQTLCLWLLVILAKLHKQSQDRDSGECPRLGILYPYVNCHFIHGGVSLYGLFIYTLMRGLLRCPSLIVGQCEKPRVVRWTTGMFHAFFL